MDFGNNQGRFTSPTVTVHSISEEGNVYSVLQRHSDDMKEMRLEMRRMSEEHRRQSSTIAALGIGHLPVPNTLTCICP